MADVDTLFNDYVAEHRAGGEANPREFLERLEGTDREELAALIDAYLARAPGQGWDPAAFEGSAAATLTDGMTRALSGTSGLWPVLLPRLRERARIRRSEVAMRLAEALGVAAEEQRVAGYYHEMEQGQLDSRGVTTRVLEALAAIVGSTAKALRDAGAPFGEAGPVPEGTVFTRRVSSDARAYDAGARAAEMAPPAPEPPAQPAAKGGGGPDEVDRLFTGGD